MSSNDENKTYKVAGVHSGKKGVTVLDGQERVLEEAEQSARLLTGKYALENSLGITNFVAFNTHALTMLPPYSIDMEAEWNYVIEQEGKDTPSVEINRQAEGSI
tara:strand:- start:281 stop:592 length:312 start_codon:yes stop_codon:yes gene_type:complete